MIDPQTIEPNVLIHEMKKSERKKEDAAKEDDDSDKVEQAKSRLKSNLERNYRGFNMPTGMDDDQERAYKAAIDKRKEELAGVEDERSIERRKQTFEGVVKSATELPGDIGEVVASVPPVASHLIGSALVAKRKAYEDPTEAIRKAREFGSKVFEGDPEAQEQALIGTSMSMVEPMATGADVELARRDIRKALETRKAGDIATAGVSTIAASIPVLGVAHFKIVKKSVDDIDEVLPEVTKVSDANQAEVAKYEDFRGKFMAHAADISDRKFSDKELEVLIDPFRSDAVRELSKTNPNIYGDLLDELRRAGAEDDRVADYLNRASAMHQMTKGGDAAGDIAGSLSALRHELKQYNPENLAESRKALDDAAKAANDVKSELSAAEDALKKLEATQPKYVPRSDPGHDEYKTALREWNRTNRTKTRALKEEIGRITGDSYFEYLNRGGSSVKLDILERNLDNARKRVEILEKGPLENDNVRYYIDGLKDKVRGTNSPGLDKETRNKIRRIIDDIEAKPGGTPGGGTPGSGAADAAKPPAATDVATAGAKTADEAEEAKRFWTEKGIDSPRFKRWSGGIEPTQIPSESLTPKLSTGDNAGWENYSREALNDKYADAYKRLLAQVPNPDNLKYIDQVAYTPDVLVVHHSTPGMRGTTIDYDAGRSFGFHAGTTEAAQHREYRLARSSRADELANPFEPKPPPHPIGQGRIQPSYDAERVFYFKYNKLLPLPDGYGWGAKSVLLDSIKSAERLNEKKFAADLKKYLDDAELRVRNAGTSWDGSANLRLNEAVEAQSVRDIYKKHGFDGVIYTNIAEDPGSLSIIAIDDSSLKLAADAPDLGKVTGEFKPTGLYGAGAAVPAAAAVRSQREDEL